MNDKEKICAEIERRMELATQLSETRESEIAQALFEGKAMAYKELLALIQKKPTNLK